jgi:hypothetical protein
VAPDRWVTLQLQLKRNAFSAIGVTWHDWNAFSDIGVTCRELHYPPKPDSDSDSDGVGAGVGVEKLKIFGVGAGIGIMKKYFSESESELIRRIFRN